jgi:hypothetical protein
MTPNPVVPDPSPLRGTVVGSFTSSLAPNFLGRGTALKDKSVLLMVLSAVGFPMVSAMIVQGHINELYPEAG